MNSLSSSPFQLEKDDVQAFQQFRSGSKTLRKTQTLLGTFLILFGMLLISGVFFRLQLGHRAPRSVYVSRPGETWQHVLGLARPLVFLAIFSAVIMWQRKRVNAQLSRFPTTVSLSDGEVLRVSGPTITRTRWDGVGKIGNTPQHLFMFVGPQEAVVVPRRAFDSDEAFARFADFARAQCEAAKPLTPPIARV